MTASHSSGVIFASVRSRSTPALLTSPSSRPNSRTAVAISESATATSEHVALDQHRGAAGALISSTTPAPTAGSNSLSTTAAPCRAHSSASPRPMPRPAPVTTTTLSSSRPMPANLPARQASPTSA